MVKQCEEKSRRFNCTVNVVILDDELAFAEMLDKQIHWLLPAACYQSAENAADGRQGR